MNADDVRWLAQKVVAKAFHGVSDASVEALARRVLELEADAKEHADNVRAVEREACAKFADLHESLWRAFEADARLEPDRWQHRQQANVARDIANAIRARGGK